MTLLAVADAGLSTLALSPDPAAPPPLLRMAGITKQFPGVLALDNVHFEVAPGEIHALLGENGAGKSTLLKILSGAYKADAGTIELGGQPLLAETPHQAQAQGIDTIYQEFNLVPQLTVAENIFMGREPGNALFLDWRKMAAATRDVLARLDLRLDPMKAVRGLSVAEQQMVEIARALSMQSRVIIMDEPTSALSEREVAHLMRIMHGLRDDGLSIIFVTHRLEEVMAVCDRITVLRDGRNAGAAQVNETSIPNIIRMMVGRAVTDLYQGSHEKVKQATPVLEVRGLRRKVNTRDPYAIVLHDITFSVRRGEIVGIAGLVGAGRTEIARALFGADPMEAGEIRVDGQPVQIASPADAIKHGIGLVPEDRKQQALFLALAVRENFSIASLSHLATRLGFMRARQEQDEMANYRQMLNIRMATPEQKIRNLSGGNQQKVVIARWMALKPKVLIVDEPTRGIDVAAKGEVHLLLHEMAAQGIGVIMISSELPEVMGMSDRILTLREGRLTGELAREEATQERLMSLMTLQDLITHMNGESGRSEGAAEVLAAEVVAAEVMQTR